MRHLARHLEIFPLEFPWRRLVPPRDTHATSGRSCVRTKRSRTPEDRRPCKGGQPAAPHELSRPIRSEIEATIRPRLDLAGADIDRIFALTTVVRPDGNLGPFNLKTDLPRLEEALDRVADARLVVIDPVTAYLGGSDDDKSSDIRALIAPPRPSSRRGAWPSSS